MRHICVVVCAHHRRNLPSLHSINTQVKPGTCLHLCVLEYIGLSVSCRTNEFGSSIGSLYMRRPRPTRLRYGWADSIVKCTIIYAGLDKRLSFPPNPRWHHQRRDACATREFFFFAPPRFDQPRSWSREEIDMVEAWTSQAQLPSHHLVKSYGTCTTGGAGEVTVKPQTQHNNEVFTKVRIVTTDGLLLYLSCSSRILGNDTVIKQIIQYTVYRHISEILLFVLLYGDHTRCLFFKSCLQ